MVWKIIKTVGGNIMKIRPANGAAADLSSALTIFIASSYTFHYLQHMLYRHQFLGVGASNRARCKSGIKLNMIITWIITLPISAILAAIIFWILNIFFKVK